MINTEPARVYTTTPNEVYYITDTTLYNYLSVPAPYTSPVTPIACSGICINYILD